MKQETTTKRRRGFAAMDPETQRRLASLGGVAAHVAGTAHEFTPAEAAIAGAKGGRALAIGRGSAYMAGLGRRGGTQRGENMRTRRDADARKKYETEVNALQAGAGLPTVFPTAPEQLELPLPEVKP